MRDNWKRAMLFQYFISITKRVVSASWIFDTDEMYIREITQRARKRVSHRYEVLHTSVPRSCDVDARV